jgi:predicted transcriptional regulator
MFEEDEKDFKLVKEFIYDHENVNIVEVSQETGVSTNKILKYLKEERLILASVSGGIVLTCESCGRAIQTGRYCFSCKKELIANLENELNNAAKNTKADEAVRLENDKMYTASRRN